LSSIYEENLAVGRPTIQSSTTGSNFASRAVDGNFGESGDFGTTYSQTEVTRSPFWEVDLGASQFIYQVMVNLVPGEFELSDFYILVSDDPFTSSNLASVLANPNVDSYYFEDFNNFAAADVFGNGRYVRIQRAGVDTQLTLGEVRVSGIA
ncbi:MAG: hypothetical protein AAGA30_08275, partial [Planctomycetota bacterium]